MSSFARNLIQLALVSVCVVLANSSVLRSQGGQANLAAALTFHASFDNGADADFALGDKRVYTAASYRNRDNAQPGLHNPDVALAPGRGKFGAALEFKAKNTMAIYYQAEKNVDYRPRDWSGSVSFWLNLDPDVDLTGFADPIQLTDKDYNDAALWVDFTGNDKPRHFRLGAFPDLLAWNPEKTGGQTNPAFLRHIVAVTTPPFARGTWTHVAFTFAGLNGQQPGTASLFLNGKLQGPTAPIPETFSWDVTKALIRVGVNYAGLYDDLAVFNRSLNESEVQSLFALGGGVSGLRR